MKNLVPSVILILSISLSQVKTDAVHGGFDEGKRYVYNYAARVATGIVDHVQQFSGLGVKGHLIVQTEGKKLILKLEDLQLGSFNKQLQNLKTAVEIEYKRPASGLEQLERPFVVEFKEGIFSSISLPHSEDVHTRNNKKAVASLLQLDLRREGVDHLHFYSKSEEGIGGECLTLYTVGHYHDSLLHQGDVLNVTKLRQYDQCKHSPHLFYSSIKGYKCPDCKQENFHPLKNLAEIHYNLKGTREHYTIEHVYSTGAITLTPFTTNGQTVLSIVNQTLDLVKIVEAEPLEIATDLDKYEHLHYEFREDKRDYKNVDLKKPHYYNRVRDVNRSDRHTKAEALLHQLENDVKHEKFSFASHYIQSLIDILSTFDYEDYEKFYDKFVLVKDLRSIDFHLWGILPFVGTNPAILYAFDKIQSGQISENIAKNIIQNIPFHVKEPTKTLIEAAKVFGRHKHVKESYPLFVASRLAYGTLLHRACVATTFNPHPIDSKHYIDDCSGYVQELIEGYNSASDNNTKSVYLRAIGNIGTKDGIKFLIGVVNSNADNLLKQNAIWNIFGESSDEQLKTEATAVLMPIFTNIDEDYVLRLYALEILIFNYPTPQMFGTLIVSLNNDPSQKFKSYLYTFLLAYTNVTDPCYKPFQELSKYVLQYVEHHQRDIIKDPVNRVFSFHNAKFHYGRSTHFIISPSQKSIFPRELYVRQTANLLGYNFDILEVGYTSKEDSVSEYFLQEFGPKGLRLPPVTVINNLVKSTLDKFKFKSRPLKQEQSYEIYTKTMNQDVYVIHQIIDDLTLRFEYADWKIENDKFLLNTTNVRTEFAGVELIIPNELGIAVSLKTSIPMTFYLRGSISTKRKGGKSTDLIFETDLHLGMDSIIHSQIALMSAFQGDLGYALKTEAALHVPIKGQVEFEEVEWKLKKIKYIPTAEPYDILQYQSVPQTIGDGKVLPVHYSTKPVQKQYSCGHDYLGVGVTFNFTYDYYWNDYGSYRQFLKSFFKKPSSYEDYFYLSEKWYAGTRNFLDYAILNPTAKPFNFNARISPSNTNPTTEFVVSFKNIKDKSYDFETNQGKVAVDSQYHIVGKGPVERTFDFEVGREHNWPNMQLRKEMFHFKRSPLPNYDTQPFEVCYVASNQISDYSKIYTLRPVDIKVNYDGHLIVGKDCSDNSKHIYIKSVLEKSEEQKNIQENTLPFFNKCYELAEKEDSFNDYCWKYYMHLGRLDKLTLDVDHKNIPPSVKDFFHRMALYFRHRFYNNLYVDYQHGSGNKNHLQVVAKVSYEHPTVVDFKVTHPNKTVYYNHVYMPSILPHFEPPNVAESPEDHWARKMFNYHTPMCSVSAKYGHTFDGVTFKLSLEDCYHLAFADTNADHVYIYYRRAKDIKFTMEALVYMNDGNETLVKFGATDGKIGVTVNDRQILHDGKDAYFLRQDSFDSIYKFAEGYAIKSMHMGFQFYYDGTNSVITASNFYRGKQRGICGNFDGETNKEFEGPDGHIYKTGTEFTHSYLVPEECTH